MAITDDQQGIYNDFRDSVNMAPKEIEDWLETDESQSVGQTKGDDDESVGHKMGGRIVEIKRTKKADLTDDDFDAMAKVNSYVARHSKQRPDGDVSDTRWCYSLKNWGHDPTK